MSNPSVDRIRQYNEARQREYESSKLITLMLDENTSEATKKALLVYVQPWSDAFQRMMAARVAHETDPQLLRMAVEHASDESGDNVLLAKSRGDDQRVVWDPIIAAGASWFIDQLSSLPSVQRAVLSHLGLEAGSLTFAKAGAKGYPGNEFFDIHADADIEHLEMGYRILEERTDWTEDEIITLLDQSWQVITVVSDRIAECALRDTVVK